MKCIPFKWKLKDGRMAIGWVTPEVRNDALLWAVYKASQKELFK